MSTDKSSYKPASSAAAAPEKCQWLDRVRKTLGRLRELLRSAFGLFMLALIAIAVSSGCGSQPAPPPAPGSISTEWAIQDQNRLFITCERVGAVTVRFRLRDQAGATSALSFPCSAGTGTSAVAPGVYDVSGELANASGAVLATTASQPATVTSGKVTKLLASIFVASTQTRLVLSFSAPPTTSNCKTSGAGGAGITGSSLTLLALQGSCSPVTFQRMRGTTPTGTYQVVCAAPPVAACFERDETLTANVTPGTYLLHARGKVSGADCWSADETLLVPPPGDPLVREVALKHQSLPGC